MKKIKIKKIVSKRNVAGAYACPGKCFNAKKMTTEKNLPTTKYFK